MDQFNVGVSSLDITPDVGTELCGYAKRTGGNKGILDNLFLKVLSIRTSSKTVVLISCDLIGLDNEFVIQVRKAIAKRFNLEYKSIMISCSHTHSGPATMRNIGIGEKNFKYLNFLFYKCIEGTKKALNSLQNAEIYYHRGESQLGINRRGIIEKGTIEPAEDPSGFVDKDVSVIAFYKENSKELISILFNYGCHPTVLDYRNNYVSSDYPGAAHRFIKENINDNITSFFINGGSGNINPLFRGDSKQVNLAGKHLGQDIITTIESNGLKLTPQLEFNSFNVIAPYIKILSKEDYNDIIEKIKEGESSELYKANMKWANKYYLLASEGRIPSFLQTEIQFINIGDICIVGIPFEVFAETSHWIKQELNLKTIVAGYTNGNYGYLPTPNEIIKGGYEVLEAHKYYDRPNCFSGEAEKNIRNSIFKFFRTNI